MERLAPLEIKALAQIVDELDYYELLHLPHDASVPQIKKAYFQSSRTFHPDANGHLEAELLAQCSTIAKRITEAYCVLRDPRRRRAYNEMLSSGDGGVRMQLAEAKAAHAKQDTEERQGKTPQGRQFFQKAMEDVKRRDRSAAVRNLQMALTFEPDNEGFKQKLDEVKKAKLD